ncbi:MAG TPA: hypothetical protein VFQ21_02535 [Gemmatimonadota bacterium]|nr:hypothetical protein [Gemmatimonadota bacterium]
MTTDRTPEEHPTDLELAAWADEPETADEGVRAHVAGCERCGAELSALAETRAILAIGPPLPTPGAFAAQRERILAAISAEPRRDGRVVGRIAWLAPIAAAAAIAAFFLIDRTGEPGSPESPDMPAGIVIDAEEFLPVVADAAAAAEEAADAVAIQEDPASGITLVPSEAIDEELLDTALVAAEPLAPPIAIERSLTTELHFAELPEDEQSAVLLELASSDLDY